MATPGISCGHRSAAKNDAEGCSLCPSLSTTLSFPALTTWITHQGSAGGLVRNPRRLQFLCLCAQGCSHLAAQLQSAPSRGRARRTCSSEGRCEAGALGEHGLLCMGTSSSFKQTSSLVAEHWSQRGGDDSGSLPVCPGIAARFQGRHAHSSRGLSVCPLKLWSVPGSNASKGQLCSAACPHLLP